MTNKEYLEYLKSKSPSIIKSGFEISEEEINSVLFPFQKFAVKKALHNGKFAIFANCGLGKTIMQLEWAEHIVRKFKQSVLVVAPLAVVGQTIKEGEKFGYKVREYNRGMSDAGIYIINYDGLPNVDVSEFIGVVLDESSILKNFTGATKKMIIDVFAYTPYKLACTATPSPNDIMEICNHAEFLNVMSRNEMLAMYFVHDGGETTKWRLKGQCEDMFWDFVSQWALMFCTPSDIGFSDDGYILPELLYNYITVKTPKTDNGKLFNDDAVSATTFNAELKRTRELRLDKVAEIANSTMDNVIIWINQDADGDYLRKLIPDAVEVRGSEPPERKRDKLLGFADNQFRVLITKLKIAQFGLNYQNCHNQIFASLDFSFESTYQGIRRSWRFGQNDNVNIYIVSPDTMTNVKEIIDTKQNQFLTMQKKMAQATSKNLKSTVQTVKSIYKHKTIKLPTFI